MLTVVVTKCRVIGNGGSGIDRGRGITGAVRVRFRRFARVSLIGGIAFDAKSDGITRTRHQCAGDSSTGFP